MEELQTAVAQALDRVESLLSELERTESGMVGIREELVHDTEELASQWTGLAAEMREVLSELNVDADELLKEAPVTGDSQVRLAENYERLKRDMDPERETVEHGLAALGERLHALAPELDEAVEDGEQALAALLGKAASVEGELKELIDAVGKLVEETIAAELIAFQQELSLQTDAVGQALLAQFTAALDSKLGALLERLETGEHRLAEALEASGTTVDQAARVAVGGWAECHEQVGTELAGLGATLETTLKELDVFAEEGARSVGRERESMNEAWQGTRDGIDAALALIRDTEDMLRRYDFVKF